ncbi:hypothetical protein PM082_008228 [Marasmius tenuissimus]|nr:hypothetical protein PM082_008228 [Marasmius tenuissimus]
MTVGGDDQHTFDAASPSNVGPNSSLPSSLLPHLYTGPSSGRTSRDSGTRTTFYSTDEDRDDVVVDENSKDGNENEVQYPDTVSGTGVDKSYRHSMVASAGSQASQEQPSSPTAATMSSTGFQHHHQQPLRSHYANNEPLATTSSSGSSAIEMRPPIRSDPVFYAQGVGNTYSHGQIAAYPAISIPSSPGPGPSRRDSIGAGTGFGQPNGLPASSMLQSPVSPDSPYSQVFNDSSSSHSPDSSYKDYHLTHIMSPPGRDWPRSSVNPVVSRDQGDIIRTYDEIDNSLYRGSMRSFEEVERGPSTFNSASEGSRTISESNPSNKTKKTLIACGFCRKRRIRCDGNRPSCFQCRSREDQVCIYDVAPRRRGPGKANKGSRGTKPKNGYVERSRQHDEDENTVGSRTEISELPPQYLPFNERGAEDFGPHHQQDFRADTYFQGPNEGPFIARIVAPHRQQSYANETHSVYLPHHPQRQQQFPPLPYPRGPSPEREWHVPEVPRSQPVSTWSLPLPYEPSSISDHRHELNGLGNPPGFQGYGVCYQGPPASLPRGYSLYSTYAYQTPSSDVPNATGRKMKRGRSASPLAESR